MSLDKELDLDFPFRDVCHEAVLNIIRTAAVLAQEGANLFRRFDLTVAQFNVLFALKYKDRTVTQSELGHRLVLTRASITSVLDKLEEKGLVTRKDVAGNRRIHHVELTKRGRKLIDKGETDYRRRVHEVMGHLQPKERQSLIDYLERIRKAVYGTGETS